MRVKLGCGHESLRLHEAHAAFENHLGGPAEVDCRALTRERRRYDLVVDFDVPNASLMAPGKDFHVIVGTIFLIVCLYRAWIGHFKPDHHFGFEAAAWYWHFVDVVWLFLFSCIYVWGE